MLSGNEAGLKQENIVDGLRAVRDGIDPCHCPKDVADGHEPSGCEGVIDVRFNLREDGSTMILSGPSDYDQDHRGFWGAGSIAHDDTDETLESLATDLRDQALDDAAGADMLEDEDEDEDEEDQ